jgi:poly(3-hydroxybutyrate) depolymerase
MKDTEGHVRYGSPLVGLLLLAILYLLYGGVPRQNQAAPAVPTLPALGAKIDETSVSGISSGAYMAGQFQMAHASVVKGAAIIAGGPYGCAQSAFADVMPGPGTAMMNVAKAINGCMLNSMAMFGVPNAPLLAEKAQALARDGKIDPIKDVLDDRVYLFSGKEDRTVLPAIVAAAADFYRKLGVPADHLMVVSDFAAGHAFVTEHAGSACGVSGKPYVVDCDYDQAGALLQHIYGPLQPPAIEPTGSYLTFDQTPFTAGVAKHGLSDIGEVYVPKSCETTGGCRVHIAFHGCAQNRATVGDAFVQKTGFARWADTNDFIVLFPQTAAGPANPQACWDWWGYTGGDFLTKHAAQISAVYRMLERLGRARPNVAEGGRS